MVNRLVSVGDDFTLPAAVKAVDANLPARLGATALNATILDIGGDAFAGRQATPTNAEATGIYDRRLNVYNLKPSQLRRSRAAAAKAAAGTGFYRVTALGDSTVAGDKATGTTSWPAALKNRLAAAGIPSAGTGIVQPYSGSTFTDNRWTLGVGWDIFSPASGARLKASGTEPITFTSSVPGTIARIYYMNESTWSYSIDGAAPVAGPTGGGYAVQVVEVAGLANTTHTIEITRTGGTGKLWVYAAEVRNSATSGVLMYNGGITGQQISTLSTTTYSYTPKFGTVTHAADTVFLMCETNDANNGITPVATYKTNYQAAITSAKANGADVVMVTAVPSSGINFTAYTAALYELADTNDLPLIDLQDRWGTYALANANGLMGDGLHPNASGYSDVARGIFNALGL